MSGKYPMSFYRHIERLWTERIASLIKICDQIVAATERVLQRMLNRRGSLVPIPVRAVADRRRTDRRRA